MCGIAGFLELGGRVSDARATLERMSATIVHRGPDEDGLHLEPGIGLAHRRLSIIDLATGQQPMATEDGDLVLVYNGEIYNYRELRDELAGVGYVFRTQSDTEVVLAGYRVQGTSFFARLNGIFAFALWDRPRRRLVLARDRLGIKPLYWSVRDGVFYFASEVKALRPVTPRRQVNVDSLALFLTYGFVPGALSLMDGVSVMSPATVVAVDAGGPREEVYWRARYQQDVRLSEEEAVTELAEKLQRVVRRQMVSDVELGAFLSGGVDSSLLVAIMAGLSSRPIQTFSIGFEEEEANEFRFSRPVAKQFATDHTEILYGQKDFLKLLSEAIWYLDEPLRHDSGVALMHLARAAKRKVTVVLTGEGSDELFLGYYKYQRADQVSRLLRYVPGLAAAVLPRRYLGWLPPRVLRPALDRCPSPPWPDLVQVDFRRSSAPSWPERLADVDCRHYLVTLLMNQDRMSMAASIESRVPYLDNELIEWAHALPLELKLRGSVGKYLLKRVAARYFPEEFLHREKMGFPVPLDRWLGRGPLREHVREVFREPSFRERGLFDAAWVAGAFDRFPSLPAGKARERLQALLWRLFTFELWARMFLD
jgi:asparagine synthase (glutamine-hydrolysing)